MTTSRLALTVLGLSFALIGFGASDALSQGPAGCTCGKSCACGKDGKKDCGCKAKHDTHDGCACAHKDGKDCGCKHDDKGSHKGCGCGHDKGDKGDKKAAPVNNGEAKVGDQTTCPLSKEVFTVTKDSPKIEHKGKTFYFCCPGCKGKADKEPAKFLDG